MSLTHLRNLEFDSGSFPRHVSSGLFALLSCSLIFSRFPRALTFRRPWCGRRDAWALRCFSGAFSFANNFLWNIFQAAWFPWTSLWSVHIGYSGMLSGAGQYRVSFLWSVQHSSGFSWTSLSWSCTRKATWLSWTGLCRHFSVVSGSFLRTCDTVTSKITSLSLCRRLGSVKNKLNKCVL